ncbi:putative CsbD-like protein [Crocosphaera subtropica ATCC 51142]|uniref:CsbD-like protein n=1 Tax=Crocosphaera subtropica (strain ATCC 51142 / BH68) TaxID=43989 RepID=B1WRK1_CROS5|nr:CsbD family protein [Crocosphaera subtropica]ACB51850.1 putative CsbD-like protein [Crocosphaera subtropica ATCC 51142]
MSTQDRVEATKSNIEGKAQEAMGEITGDPQDKAKGEAKQEKAKAQHAVEDAKDKVKQALD